MFGTYDQAQLQRGFQVYKEVCSNCHALSIPFRTLAEPGGPGFTEDQVKTLAATYQVTNAEPNDKGEIFKRPGTPADIIPRPEAYPNDQAAAAAFGKAPPDMAAARQGAQIRARLSLVHLRRAAGSRIPGDGRRLHPRDPHRLHEARTTRSGTSIIPGHKIAMPQPITDGAVEYKDGTPPTLDNYANDVAAFLTWAAEPKLAERKKIGLRVMIFLFVLAGLLYFTKKRVWEDLRTDQGCAGGPARLRSALPGDGRRGEEWPRRSSESSAVRASTIFPG